MHSNSDKNLIDKSGYKKTAFPFVIIVALLLGIFLGIFIGGFPGSINEFFENSSKDSKEDVLDSNSTYYDEEELGIVYEIIKQRYIGSLPEEQKVTDELIKGLVNALDDPYTIYLTPEETEEYKKSRSGDFEGIGVSLSYDGQNTFVETVFEGFPAENAGVMVGDIIIEVDGEDMNKKTPEIVATKIRGEKGTDVKIKIYRESESALKDLIITRDTILVDNISWEKVDENTALIDISQFSDESPSAFNKSWDKVKNQINNEYGENLDSLIIDLRNNPGGYVVSVKYVLEDFLKNGSVMMQEREKDKEPVIFKDQRKGLFEDTKVVVIVNQGSASASEIFAAAIKENGRGEIIGMKTVGKGVEQEVIDSLPGGGMLFVVFQEWLTPNGNSLDKENPITPDIIVDFTNEDYKNGVDPQLNKAKELVK